MRITSSILPVTVERHELPVGRLEISLAKKKKRVRNKCMAGRGGRQSEDPNQGAVAFVYSLGPYIRRDSARSIPHDPPRWSATCYHPNMVDCMESQLMRLSVSNM